MLNGEGIKKGLWTQKIFISLNELMYLSLWDLLNDYIWYLLPVKSIILGNVCLSFSFNLFLYFRM